MGDRMFILLLKSCRYNVIDQHELQTYPLSRFTNPIPTKRGLKTPPRAIKLTPKPKPVQLGLFVRSTCSIR